MVRISVTVSFREYGTITLQIQIDDSEFALTIKQYMNRSLLPTMLGALSLLVSCNDDNSIFNEPEAIRAYETDAQILAQFVEVDKTSGTYVLNPNKKITATDYVVNKSQEDLLAVSQINKDRFLKEMESVNNQLSVVKRSGLASAFIYSTQTSSIVIDGNCEDSCVITRLGEDSNYGGRVACLTLEAGRNNTTNFFSQSDMVMTVNAGNRSTFYCAQVSLGDQVDKDAEIIYISGIRSYIPIRSYRLDLPTILDNNKIVSGCTIIGDGNLTVSFSR